MRQTAYRIAVHEVGGNGAMDEAPVFDTGRVFERILRHATATATKNRDLLPLVSNRQYRWQLTVSAMVGGESGPITGIATGRFRTALLHTNDFHASRAKVIA